MRKKLGKKGFLAKEAVNMLLAIACIILLIYLAVQLYSLTQHKSKTDQAKATLDAIITKINGLKEGVGDKYISKTPNGWYLVYYDYDFIKSNSNFALPEKCGERNCLCICPSIRELVDLQRHCTNAAQTEKWSVAPSGIYFSYGEGKIKENECPAYGGLKQCNDMGVCKQIDSSIKIRNPYFGDRDNPMAETGSEITVSEVNYIRIASTLFSIKKKKDASGKDYIYLSDAQIDSNIMTKFLNWKSKTEPNKLMIDFLLEGTDADRCSKFKVSSTPDTRFIRFASEGEVASEIKNFLYNNFKGQNIKIVLTTVNPLKVTSYSEITTKIIVKKTYSEGAINPTYVKPGAKLIEETVICPPSENAYGAYIRIYQE